MGKGKPRKTKKEINERLLLEKIQEDNRARRLVLEKVRKINQNKK